MQNPGRKKITELYENRTRRKEYRDAAGKIQHEKIPYRATREVQVVDGWARFGHYLIDQLILAAASFGLSFLGLAIMQFVSPVIINQYGVQFNLLGSFFGIGYYFLCETFMGTTLGKMALGHVVINEYGERPDAGSVALRSISRLVPFEAFSCISGRGWHDTWSGTFVVHKNEAEYLRQLRQQQEMEAVQELSADYLAKQK